MINIRGTTLVLLLAMAALALLTVTIEEGFESGAMPPPGWALARTNPRETWETETLAPKSGYYYAQVICDEELEPQDETLLSPEFRPAAGSGHVELWSKGSLYWCRDYHDNCDLEVWFVKGDWDRGGGDVLLGLADGDWLGTWVWSPSAFEFGEHADGGPARVAFRYVGQDGAQISVDDVTVIYENADPEGKVFLPVILRGWISCETARSEEEYDE